MAWREDRVLRENLVANPAWRASNGSATIATNFVKNPCFRAVLAPSEIRRNLAPRPQVASTNNNSLYVGTSDSSVGRSSTSTRFNPTAANAGTTIASVYAVGGVSNLPVTPSYPYSFSCYVATNVASTSFVSFQWRDSSGTVISTENSASVSIPASPASGGKTWVRLSFSSKAPSNAATVLSGVFVSKASGAAVSTTDAVWFADALFEQNFEVLPYFDGSYSTEVPGLTTAWAGSSNLSDSTATGSRPTYVGHNGNYTVGYQVNTESVPFMRVIPASNQSRTSAGGFSQSTGADFPIGPATYSCEVRAARPEDVGKTVRLMIYQNTAPISMLTPSVYTTLTDQWQRVILHTTTDAVANARLAAYIYNDAGDGALCYDVRKMLLTWGTCEFDYFDGSTAPSGYSNTVSGLPSVQTAWQSTSDLSYSLLSGQYATVYPFMDYSANSGQKSWLSGNGSLYGYSVSSVSGPPVFFTGNITGGINTYTAGDYAAMRYQVRQLSGPPITLRTSAYAYQGGAGRGSIGYVETSLTSSWQDVVLPSGNPVPGGADNVRFYIQQVTATPYGGVLLEFRNALMEKVSGPGMSPGAYFDGSSVAPSDPLGFRYRWTGAVDTSTSQMYLPQLMAPGGNLSSTTVSTSDEHWFVDGYDITNNAFNISKDSFDVPELRGSHTVLPQRSGVLPRFNRSYEAGDLSLQMWVLGCEPDGSIPGFRSGRREVFERNLHFLLSLFHQQSSPVWITKQSWIPSVGPGLSGSGFTETKATRAIISGATSLETMMARQRGELTVNFTLIDSFWTGFGSGLNMESSTASATLPQTIKLIDMASAPVEDALVTVVGPVATPRITCPEAGCWVQYNGNLTAGQTLTLDCSTWTAKIGNTDVTTSVTHGGNARWLYIPPRDASSAYNVSPANFQPSLVLSGSGASSATSFNVKYYRKYLLP